MTQPAKKPETPLESDPVWDLVDKAPTQPASSHFARSTVQLIRNQQERQAWWKNLFAPMPIAGLAAAAAAITLMVSISFTKDQPSSVASYNSEEAVAIQEIVEAEMLIVAADNPAEFSDQELVALIGF